MRALLLLWSLAPLLWQLRTSFLVGEALVGESPGSGRSPWTLENYRLVLNGDPSLAQVVLNSALLGLLTTGLTLLLAVPCAYGLHHLRGRLQPLISAGLVGAALFPTVLLFLSLLQLARWLGLANQPLALSLPYTALSLPLAILLLRAAIQDLPPELEDAARLDGLNTPQRLRLVVAPLLTPAMASTGLLVFLASWNEYPIALTWLSRADRLTLPAAMGRIASSSVFTIPYGPFAAATVLGSLPLLVLVLLFQRWIISGLTQGAVKG
ncbi:MAG: carbohydrate ABC transporter permease [Cyanobacteriota bacterium]|jgi:multiple sugar transport system permease protein